MLSNDNCTMSQLTILSLVISLIIMITPVGLRLCPASQTRHLTAISPRPHTPQLSQWPCHSAAKLATHLEYINATTSLLLPRFLVATVVWAQVDPAPTPTLHPESGPVEISLHTILMHETTSKSQQCDHFGNVVTRRHQVQHHIHAVVFFDHDEHFTSDHACNWERSLLQIHQPQRTTSTKSQLDPRQDSAAEESIKIRSPESH